MEWVLEKRSCEVAAVVAAMAWPLFALICFSLSLSLTLFVMIFDLLDSLFVSFFGLVKGVGM